MELEQNSHDIEYFASFDTDKKSDILNLLEW